MYSMVRQNASAAAFPMGPTVRIRTFDPIAGHRFDPVGQRRAARSAPREGATAVPAALVAVLRDVIDARAADAGNAPLTPET
jgi:hypothetical protein